MQELGGEDGGQVRPRQQPRGRLLDDDSEVHEVAAPAVALLGEVEPEEPLLGGGVPVRGPSGGGVGDVQVLADLLGRYGAGEPAPDGSAERPLFVRDGDAHAPQTRTRSILTEGQKAFQVSESGPKRRRYSEGARPVSRRVSARRCAAVPRPLLRATASRRTSPRSMSRQARAIRSPSARPAASCPTAPGSGGAGSRD